MSAFRRGGASSASLGPEPASRGAWCPPGPARAPAGMPRECDRLPSPQRVDRRAGRCTCRATRMHRAAHAPARRVKRFRVNSAAPHLDARETQRAKVLSRRRRWREHSPTPRVEAGDVAPHRVAEPGCPVRGSVPSDVRVIRRHRRETLAPRGPLAQSAEHEFRGRMNEVRTKAPDLVDHLMNVGSSESNVGVRRQRHVRDPDDAFALRGLCPRRTGQERAG